MKNSKIDCFLVSGQLMEVFLLKHPQKANQFIFSRSKKKMGEPQLKKNKLTAASTIPSSAL